MVWIKRKTGKQVNRVHSDNASKYLGLKSWLANTGIRHTTTTTYCSESNDLNERMKRTLLDIAYTMVDNEKDRCTRYVLGRRSKIRFISV